MNPQVVVPYWQDRSPEDGILFVRTKGILTTMVRATLVAVGLIVMAISMPIQSTFGTIRTLELIVYPDGTTHISSEISADPLEPDFTVKLFGTTIDNSIYFISGGIAAAGAIAAVFMKRSKGTTTKKITETIVKQEQITEKSLDVETIFELRPELRDDDKKGHFYSFIGFSSLHDYRQYS